MPIKQAKEILKEISKEIKEKHEKDHKDKYEKEKLEKEHKDKPEKEKREKEGKEVKELHKEFVKEISKIELPETLPQQPQIPDPAPFEAQAQTEASVAKHIEKFAPEKIFKVEIEKNHKIEHDKIFKFEKYEHWEYVQGPVATDPGGPVEQRLAALEAAMAQLVHFIPQEQRPDLSKGALKQEPAEGTTQKPEEEKKK